jgi:hypothetical protein
LELTPLLVQMARALDQQVVPAYRNSVKAWRRSWMLGYCAAVVTRGPGRTPRSGALMKT